MPMRQKLGKPPSSRPFPPEANYYGRKKGCIVINRTSQPSPGGDQRSTSTLANCLERVGLSVPYPLFFCSLSKVRHLLVARGAESWCQDVTDNFGILASLHLSSRAIQSPCSWSLGLLVASQVFLCVTAPDKIARICKPHHMCWRSEWWLERESTDRRYFLARTINTGRTALCRSWKERRVGGPKGKRPSRLCPLSVSCDLAG